MLHSYHHFKFDKAIENFFIQGEIMNRKTIILAVFSFVFLYSCQTGPVVWDNSYPEEKLTNIKFNNMKINSYNGINVSKFNYARIPAGQTSIGADVTIFHTGIQFLVKEMEFSYNFEAGKEYTVVGSTKDMHWGVSIFEEKELLGFVPFKEQPKFTK